MVSPVYNKLNKIDSILKSKFENVEFIDSFGLPKSSKGHEQYMFVVESNENPNYKIKIVVDGVDALMMERSLTWSYFEDTNNDNSNKIMRNSNLELLSQDVLNIFERKMFSGAYLESIVVNESVNTDIEVEDKPLFENRGGVIYVSENALLDLFAKYGIVLEDLEMVPQFSASGNMGTRYLPSEPNGYEVMGNLVSEAMDGNITPSTLIQLENEINQFENVDCYFNTHSYKVTIRIDSNEAELVD